MHTEIRDIPQSKALADIFLLVHFGVRKARHELLSRAQRGLVSSSAGFRTRPSGEDRYASSFLECGFVGAFS